MIRHSIVICSRSYFPNIGGIESATYELLTALRSGGGEVRVLTETPLNEVGSYALEDSVVRTTSLRETHRAIGSANRVVVMGFAFRYVLSALIHRKVLVVVHHGTYNYTESGYGRCVEFLKRIFCRNIPSVCVSDYVRKELKLRCTVVPNVLSDSLQGFLHREHLRDKQFLFVGRFVNEKGIFIILEALGRVLEYYPDTSLTLVGSGPLRESILIEIMHRQLGKVVSVPGPLTGSALFEEMARHRCILVPSIYPEPFGIVALEGLACCEYVLSSNLGGLPEVLGSQGIITAPTASGFAAEMIDLKKKWHTGNRVYSHSASRLEHLAQFGRQKFTETYIELMDI